VENSCNVKGSGEMERSGLIESSSLVERSSTVECSRTMERYWAMERQHGSCNTCGCSESSQDIPNGSDSLGAPVRIKNKMVVPMATQKADEASYVAVNVAMTPLEC
jgi:hypothetical protein